MGGWALAPVGHLPATVTDNIRLGKASVPIFPTVARELAPPLTDDLTGDASHPSSAEGTSLEETPTKNTPPGQAVDNAIDHQPGNQEADPELMHITRNQYGQKSDS